MDNFRNQITRPIRVDLHIHTTASDGTDAPADIVKMAAERSIRILAVTDHDTIDGLPEAIAAGKRLGVTVIPGIEISAGFDGQSVHILGLGIRSPDPAFLAMLQRIREGRNTRNPRIIHKLQLLGYPVTVEDVQACAGGDILGRLHIAQALVNRGLVPSIDHAFSHLLVRGGAAYVERYRPDAAEAADHIRHSGGQPVLAHPGLMRFDGDLHRLHGYIVRLKAMGLDAMETHYSGHSRSVYAALKQFARELSMIESAGSDYHGGHKSSQLGIGCCGEPIDAGDVEPLLKRVSVDLPLDINVSAGIREDWER
ncbi:PHP domain-containing protein [bacterium]|nr:PHP domain-containing protein [candidate division CSSED10-310 bacterium]